MRLPSSRHCIPGCDRRRTMDRLCYSSRFSTGCEPAVSALKCATSLEVCTSLKGKHALVTGSSRGIGRGIALKLAERGARVAVHYYQNEAAAKRTLTKIRECGSDGFVVQGEVCHSEEVSRILKQVESEFGSLDIFVSNARTEAPTFYQPRVSHPANHCYLSGGLVREQIPQSGRLQG